jgi:hypothetical protein
MVFSSTIFLFLFLPIVVAVHFALPRPARNGWLLPAVVIHEIAERTLMTTMPGNPEEVILQTRYRDGRPQTAGPAG